MFTKILKINIYQSFLDFLFLIITSHEWFVSEFSEIYCLAILGLIYLIYDQNSLNKNNFWLIGLLFGVITLINQGAVIFTIPYLIRTLVP